MTLQTLIQHLTHPDRSQRGQAALSLGTLRDELHALREDAEGDFVI
jgi:hypothetical protein